METGILDAIRKVDEVFTEASIVATFASATAPFTGGALGPVETLVFKHKGVLFNAEYDGKLRWGRDRLTPLRRNNTSLGRRSTRL